MFDTQLKIEVMKVGGLIECLHSASLIVDDIEDNSIERRGEKCAHLIYGLDSSINAANLMYFLPFKNFLSCIGDFEKKCKIMQVYMNEMINCHIGQGKDIQVHKITKA
jgi:octaprenyl-diphosphate synthase